MSKLEDIKLSKCMITYLLYMMKPRWSISKEEWVNICKAIETVRQDLVNLGFYDARLKAWIDWYKHHEVKSLVMLRTIKWRNILESCQ